jgi:membrane dipeptidase
MSILKKLGLMVMQLTYQGRNLVGDGCGEDPKTSCGLSSFGRRVIDEMNRLHILIDLTHSSQKTFMDTLKISKDPVIYSHGCAKALCDEPRGRHLSDDQIHELAEKGGVLGMMAKHLNPPITPTGEVREMTMDDYMRHFEYVVNLVGINHVGIGTENGEDKSIEDVTALSREFEVRYYKPEVSGLYPKPLHEAHLTGTATLDNHRRRYAALGTEKVAALKRNLLVELVNRGFSDKEIVKILGGNFLKIYKKIW